jgi:ArsR family metal-binding transcriptional regulator
VAKLIEDYKMELLEPACFPGSSRWTAVLTLPNDISGVFPYLNTLSDGIRYDHENKTLIWREDGQGFAFRPREIRIARVQDPQEARELAQEIVARVNQVWSDREQITPDYTERTPPPVISIFKLLPQTNCRQCGYPTCMAFAADLSRGKVFAEDCPPLCLPENAAKREEITRLFAAV